MIPPLTVPVNAAAERPGDEPQGLGQYSPDLIGARPPLPRLIGTPEEIAAGEQSRIRYLRMVEEWWPSQVQFADARSHERGDALLDARFHAREIITVTSAAWWARRAGGYLYEFDAPPCPRCARELRPAESSLAGRVGCCSRCSGEVTP